MKMQNKSLPDGITVIYFYDESKSIYAELPPDKQQAKELSKRIYKYAMTALATGHDCDKPSSPCD